MSRLLANARAALRTLLYGEGPRVFRPQVHPTATFACGPGMVRTGGHVVVGAGSVVALGRDVVLEGDIVVGEGCRVTIGAGSQLRNVVFSIGNRAVVEIGDGARFDNPAPQPNHIVVDGGALRLAEHVRLQAEVLVRFGGVLTIGRYTGIGFGSEIRCEESIEIGEYGLFSYDVCIYDTNTHSLDWEQRRRMIERMYATGAGEDRRPGTRPVRIGNDVWIGRGATVLKGSQIGDRCVVGIRTTVGGGAYAPDAVLVSPRPRALGQELSMQ